MALAQNIRYLRKKQGWRQETLAEKLGYKSYTTIQKWESGVSEPPLKVLHAIAALFNVDINDLANCDLEYEKAPTPKDERNVDDAKAAFFDGYGENLTEEEKDELWEDARIYAKFKAQQKK